MDRRDSPPTTRVCERSGCRPKHSGHPLAEYPQSLVQLYVLVDALDLARRRAATTASGIAANASQPAANCVLLNDIERRPQIVGAVISTARTKELLRHDGRIGMPVGIAEAQHVRSLSQCALGVLRQLDLSWKPPGRRSS